MLLPANAVGAATTLTVYVAVAFGHPGFETVIVSVTVESPAAGVYVGETVPCPAVIEPAPFSVQTIVPLVAVAPETVAVPVMQIVSLPPALAVGCRDIVSCFEETAGLQGADPVVVNVMVTLPAVTSASLGLYVAKVSESALANVPVPLDVQRTVPFAELAPDVTLIEFCPHVARAVPAFAVGIGATVMEVVLLPPVIVLTQSDQVNLLTVIVVVPTGSGAVVKVAVPPLKVTVVLTFPVPGLYLKV